MAARQRQHLPGSAAKDWALRAIGALAAQQRPPQPGGAPNGRGFRIGHIDTGYSDHPELAGMLDPGRGFDFVDDDNDARDPLYDIPWWPLDTPGHGTATGSVIASRASAEILGVAPEADLVPIRAVTSVVQVFDGDVARSVDHARRVGCDVITMSLGGRGFAGLRAAIAAAVAEGRIVMAAAGNFVGFVVAPAVYPECLAVAASNADSEPSSGSSRGDAVDVSAPGESVWVAAIDVGAQPPRFFADRADGTSFSVALLAGVAALWLAHHGPSAIRRQFGTANVQSAFLEMVRRTCQTPAGWDTAQFGAGIVDADALLAADLTAPRPGGGTRSGAGLRPAPPDHRGVHRAAAHRGRGRPRGPVRRPAIRAGRGAAAAVERAGVPARREPGPGRRAARPGRRGRAGGGAASGAAGDLPHAGRRAGLIPGSPPCCDVRPLVTSRAAAAAQDRPGTAG